MVHIVKIYFVNSKKETEIRRIAVTTDTLSEFKFLQEKIRKLFQMPNAINMDIKWKDSEDDYILMSSNDELAQAVANADDLLRLYVSFKEEQGDSPPKDESTNNEEMLQHPLVYCDNCEKEIFGFRYKCLECLDYDLCSSCNTANAHSKHDMIKLARPVYIARKWLFHGADLMWGSMFGHCINQFLRGHFKGVDGNAKPGSHATGQKMAEDQCSSSSSSSSASPDTKPKVPHGSKGSELNDLFECFQHYFPDSTKSLSEAALKTLPTGTPDFIQDNVKGFCELLNGVMIGLTKGEQEATAAPTSGATAAAAPTSGATAAAAPTSAAATADAANQASEAVLVDVPASAEHLQSSSMEIGSNQTPIEVEEDKNMDEIVIDPENGTTQVADGLTTSVSEGWTLLDRRMDCGEAVPTETVTYPNVMEVEADQATRPEANQGDYVQSSDPKIQSAIITMRGMGFSNEGGWLERLLVSKNGSINDTLEALYPSLH